ncbi:MAG: hypothetical protein NPIRA05_17760 [Nitrospirales bacterium]|nr:MAG: hypothetical protein NPIRA05_17760 [Nitrospirales bacterium]
MVLKKMENVGGGCKEIMGLRQRGPVYLDLTFLLERCQGEGLKTSDGKRRS